LHCGDGAVNVAFLVTSGGAIVGVHRRSRRLPPGDRSEDAQKERGEIDAMALHTNAGNVEKSDISSNWRASPARRISVARKRIGGMRQAGSGSEGVWSRDG